MKTLMITALFFSFLSKGQAIIDINCDIVEKAQFKKSKIKICGKALDVEVADSDVSRMVGLMCRKNLPENSGMIFIFPEEKPLSFWMKNTHIPLSIGYFDKNKILIDTYDMEPLNEEKVYTSTKDVLYAVEVNQGWFKKNKIKPDCKFEFLESKKAHK